MSSEKSLGMTDDPFSEMARFFSADTGESVAICVLEDCMFATDSRCLDAMWAHLEESHEEIYKGTDHYKATLKQTDNVSRGPPSLLYVHRDNNTTWECQ